MPAIAQPRTWLSGSVLSMDGALKRIASTIEQLRGDLDLTSGDPLAAHFDDLYDYLGRQLRAAHVQSDPEILDGVVDLLREVRSARAVMPPYARAQAPAIRE